MGTCPPLASRFSLASRFLLSLSRRARAPSGSSLAARGGRRGAQKPCPALSERHLPSSRLALLSRLALPSVSSSSLAAFTFSSRACSLWLFSGCPRGRRGAQNPCPALSERHLPS